MRTAAALLAAGALASCLAGEHRRPSAVVPDADAQRALGLLNARCTLCHSTDLITQQRLDGSQWRATVNKMVGWGASLTSEEREILVAYLASRYRPD